MSTLVRSIEYKKSFLERIKKLFRVGFFGKNIRIFFRIVFFFHFTLLISLLDVTFRGNQSEFITDLSCKPTDDGQYILFQSCYLSHINSSIIFSQALRMRIICSRRIDLVANVKKLKDWFKERGY